MNLFYRRYGKRVLDLILGAVVLLVAAPFMVLAAILLRLSQGPGILFSQKRPGVNGTPFLLFKYRTMIDARDPSGQLLPDADRLTIVGCLLRALSLDELPELWNVLRGDMSLVGPRPLLMEYLGRYTPDQLRRHEVKPGITGWAQINGRNALDWEDRFRHDVWYVDHLSLWLDFKILWLTLFQVVRRQGISAQGHATMPKYLGPGKGMPSVLHEKL